MSWEDYAAQWSALHLGASRQASQIVRGWLRVAYLSGRALAGVRPNTITGFGVALSVLVPLAALVGGVGFFIAAVLVLLTAVADSADGAVAVMTGRTSRLGSYYDAMADRLTEAAWLVALWLAGVPAALVAACGALAWLHEYARARAAASGMTGVGVVTVAERPTRVIAAVVGFALAGVAAMVAPRLVPGLLTVIVAVWTALGVLGLLRLTNAIRTRLRR